MKTKLFAFLMLITTVLFSSCNSNKETESKVTNEGKTMVQNGKGLNDTVTFKCVGCSENLNLTMFNEVIKESSNLAKENLKNPLSFKPLSMDILVKKEDSLFSFDTGKKIDSVISIFVTYQCIGQNAYGTEQSVEQIQSLTLVNGKIQDISKDVKLDSLRFDDGYVNRSLSVYESDNYIKLTPTKDKGLIVESSLSCVDEGTTFMIQLVNGEKIELKSWNDFNCDGISYFNFYTKSQQLKLKNTGIKYLYIYSRGKSVLVGVPKNKSDYLQQLISLY